MSSIASTLSPPTPLPASARLTPRPTPLDLGTAKYLRDKFGNTWTWSDLLRCLEAAPFDAELLRHLQQASTSTFTTSPLCSVDVKEGLMSWDSMSAARQAEFIASALDQVQLYAAD